MKKGMLLATASVFAAALAAPSFAQGELLGLKQINDQIEDVERDVARDLARSNDAARFGNPEFRPGLSGSASLSFSGKTGNNESQDMTLGLRLRDARGQFVQTLGAVVDFQEVDNKSAKKDVFMIYDASYYFDDRFYAFGMARLQSNGLAGELSDSQKRENADLLAAGQPEKHNIKDQIHRDGFIGFGPGYRVVAEPNMTWRLQAGIGASYLRYGDGRSETEKAGIVSSRFFYQINENVFVTNDTDVVKSKSALRANNDLGLNFKVTDALSTRISYLTEYNDSRAIKTDNKLGVAVVFGF